MSWRRMWLRLRAPLRLTVLLPLIGCTAQAYSPAVTATSNPCKVIPLVTYAKAYNDELASEIAAADEHAEWPGAITDYIRLRDAVRACQATVLK